MSVKWVSKWMEEFIFKAFLLRVWRVCTVKGNILYPEYEIVEEEEVVAVQATNGTGASPRPTASAAFRPNCALRKSWYKAPYALTRNQREGSEPHSGLTRHRFFSYQRGRKDHPCPVEQLIWPTSHDKGIKGASEPPSPTPEQSSNWAGSRSHYSSSCIFQAQWTHIYAKKARSESHFRTVKGLMLDPLSWNFFSSYSSSNWLLWNTYSI